MPPVCTLCRHPDRAEIDAALVVPAEPLRIIAERFGTSAATLLRHKDHLPRALVVAVEAAAVAQADTLLEKVHTIEADARRLLEKAEKSGDFRCAIAAAKTSLDVVELLLKVRDAEREEADPLTWKEALKRLEDRPRAERLTDLKEALEGLPVHDLEEIVPDKIRTLAGLFRDLAERRSAEPPEARIRRVRADLLELPPAERLAVLSELPTAATCGTN